MAATAPTPPSPESTLREEELPSMVSFAIKAHFKCLELDLKRTEICGLKGDTNMYSK